MTAFCNMQNAVSINCNFIGRETMPRKLELSTKQFINWSIVLLVT